MSFIFCHSQRGTTSRSRSGTGSSHTAAAEQTTRNRVFAVSASRGDVGLNLHQSGTISTNLTPSSIPLFRFERILTPLCDSSSRRMGFAFERKPSGSLLTSGGAKNLRQRRIPLFQAYCFHLYGVSIFTNFPFSQVPSNTIPSQRISFPLP